MLPQFIRKAFRGRRKYNEKQARQETRQRAWAASELLDNSAFIDAYQCELDILVDGMLEIEPVTVDDEMKLLRLHARARELSNLITHIQSFVNQGKVLKLQEEKK